MLALRTMADTSRVVAGLGFLALLVDAVLSQRAQAIGFVEAIEGVRVDHDAPHTSFEPITIAPTVDANGALLRITAHIRTPDGAEHTFSNDAPIDVGGASVRIKTIGVAPVLTTRARGGGAAEETVTPLGIWNPESKEHGFRLPGVSATALARYYPDFDVGPAGPTSRSMLERDPVLHLQLIPDAAGGPAGQAFLRPGDSYTFGTHEVGLVGLRHWSKLELRERRHHQPALAGFLLISIGLISSQLVRRLRAQSEDDRDGDSD